jgi:uncharacterized protein YyaL (SSP411 family)
MTLRMGDQRRPNRLIDAKSPYLRRHAFNPVDWYPWGEEAFRKAKEEDKPIFLSIGYLACHWCSVMERESFSDEEVAKVLNRHFVPIKVDREEHPHVDEYYMRAVQLMTGTGGWPLSVFLTPDLKPFYGGTYFPKEPRYGLPSFRQVLDAVIQAWKTRREQVLAEAERIDRAVRESFTQWRRPEKVEPSRRTIEAAFDQLVMLFDDEYGGFGSAPKFPNQGYLMLLLRHHHLTGDPVALKMLRKTLDAMMRGGIMDQVGGGFHRYAVDRAWRIPHFEKMLYDNALLVQVYSEAYAVTRDPSYAEVVRLTADFLRREMRSECGAFCSSLDAESEGVEGLFYTWTYEEIVSAFGPDVGKKVAAFFGATPAGNFEGGRNVLFRAGRTEELASALGVEPSEAVELVRMRLMELRGSRVRPERDEKVIASWNGLAVSALVSAALHLRERAFLGLALEVMGGLRSAVVEGSRVWRYWLRGRSDVEGRLEDYAAVGNAAFDVFSLTGDDKWLDLAVKLLDAVAERFASDDGTLQASPRDERGPHAGIVEDYEGVVPSGASLTFLLAAKVFHATGEERAYRLAEMALRTCGRVEDEPLAFPYLVASMPILGRESRELFVAYESGEPFEHVTAAVRSFQPYTVFVPVDRRSLPAHISNTARDKVVISPGPTYYLCEGFSCRMPTNDPEELARMMGEGG